MMLSTSTFQISFRQKLVVVGLNSLASRNIAVLGTTGSGAQVYSTPSIKESMAVHMLLVCLQLAVEHSSGSRMHTPG